MSKDLRKYRFTRIAGIAMAAIMAVTMYSPVAAGAFAYGAEDTEGQVTAEEGPEIAPLTEAQPEEENESAIGDGVGTQILDAVPGDDEDTPGVEVEGLEVISPEEIAELGAVTSIKVDKKHCAVVLNVKYEETASVSEESGEQTEGENLETENPEDNAASFNTDKITIRKKIEGKGSLVRPSKTVDGHKVYVLTKGYYCILINHSGYYKTKMPFYVGSSDLKKTRAVTAYPQKMSGNGNEPTDWIFRWNPEVEKKAYSNKAYEGIIDTPSFDADKKAHEFMSMEERNEYIYNATHTENGELKPNTYMYYLDEEEHTPIVFFTEMDLSEAKTAKEAAAIMARSDKLKFCYQAGVHGNEPVGGEAATYMVSQLAGEYGQSLVSQMDLYVIPCINPEGATAFDRTNNKIDLNRDALRVSSERTKQLHEIFAIVMPEATLDCHESHYEYSANSLGIISHLDDIRIRGVDNLNTGSRERKWSATMTSAGMKYAKNAGLRPFYYYSTINSTAARGFYGMYNSASVIIESVGLHEGKDHYDRRVWSQVVAVEGMLNKVADSSASIKSDVNKERRNTAEKAKTYSTKNTFVLKHKRDGSLKYSRPNFKMTGKVKDASKKANSAIWSKKVKTRAIPTAYVFSVNAKNAETVKSALETNGIKVYKIKEGTTMKLAQYYGTRTAAKLRSKVNKTFEDGAYMIPTSQAGVKVICDSLEPDVYDNNVENKTETLSYIMKISELYRYTGNDPMTKFAGDIDQDGEPAVAK